MVTERETGVRAIVVRTVQSGRKSSTYGAHDGASDQFEKLSRNDRRKTKELSSLKGHRRTTVT